MGRKKSFPTTYDYVHSHPESVTSENLERLKKWRQVRAWQRETKTYAEVIAFADHLGVPLDAPNRRNFLTMIRWMTESLRPALERALTVKRLDLKEGSKVVLGDEKYEVERIQRDFMVRLKEGFSTSPLPLRRR